MIKNGKSDSIIYVINCDITGRYAAMEAIGRELDRRYNSRREISLSQFLSEQRANLESSENIR